MRHYSRNDKCLKCHRNLPEDSEAFCSSECAEDYCEGYGEWLRERYRDREAEEREE